MNAFKIFRSPSFWLALQLLTIAALGSLLGYWHVQMHPDSGGYLYASKMPLEPALRQSRTLGYPIILRSVAAFSPDYQALPWVQLAMLCPAVFLWNSAMRCFGASPWQAFAVSSGFMYGAIQPFYTIASVLTDFPAVVASGMAIACLFGVAANQRNGASWLGLTFFLAAAYQIRPAYLFLIPLAPCLGLMLGYLRARKKKSPFFWKTMLAALIGVSALPFLAFCTLRYAIVKDFALVSFGGTNAVGMAAELLDARMIESELPEEFRPLAREIFQGRMKCGLRPAFPGGWWVDMRAYEDNYTTNISIIAKPIARKMYGEDLVTLNRELVRFSREVIGLRKGKFLVWAVYYWPRAVLKAAYRYWILQAAVPLALLMFIIRRCRCSPLPNPSENSTRAAWNTAIFPAVLWLNMLYFAAAISVLIISGSYADSRLIVPATVYLPSLLGLIILRELKLLSALRKAM